LTTFAFYAIIIIDNKEVILLKNTENIYQEIKSINNTINELNNKQYNLRQKYVIESYKERMGLIGKCFREKNTFFKIIDLEITNEFRCITITFTKEDFNIINMGQRYGEDKIIYSLGMHTIVDLGPPEIIIDSIMIKDLKNMEEIDNELFSLEYFEQCKRILDVDKFLLNERMKIINKKESGE
jgi:hypothetical protein